MGSQVEVEVSGCFCLQYKSSYATSFHPQFFTPFRSTKLLKQMSNCCAFCVFCCLSIVFVFLSILVVAPFVFVCFGSLTLRGLEFLWNTQPPAPKLLLWGPQSICSPRIGQHDMSSLRFQRNRECRK